MRGERSGESLDAKVFRVGECQKALDRACKKVGADRITHHDFRHLFATRCIESGVDIPTVFPLAWTQRRGRAGDENLRSLAPGTQYRASATCHVHAGCDEAGGGNRIFGSCMTERLTAQPRKTDSFLWR